MESLDIPHVEQDDTMGMIVAIPEELGEDIEDEIEVHYDKLMEDAEERLTEAGEAAEKDVAAMKTSTASLSGPPDSGKPAKSFESKGNDVLGGIDLSRFEPR